MASSSPMVPETKMKGTSGIVFFTICSAVMPSKLGSVKSHKMTSACSPIARKKSASVSTRSRVALRPARLSSSWMSSTSSTTSSTEMIRRFSSEYDGCSETAALYIDSLLKKIWPDAYYHQRKAMIMASILISSYADERLKTTSVDMKSLLPLQDTIKHAE